MRTKTFAKCKRSKKVYITGIFLCTNINLYLPFLLCFTIPCLVYLMSLKIISVEFIYMEAKVWLPQGSSLRRNSTVASNFVHYTTNCTERLHLKPFTDIQLRFLFQFLVCSSAVILLVRNSPPYTHIVQFFILLMQCRSALHVP